MSFLYFMNLIYEIQTCLHNQHFIFFLIFFLITMVTFFLYIKLKILCKLFTILYIALPVLLHFHFTSSPMYTSIILQRLNDIETNVFFNIRNYSTYAFLKIFSQNILSEIICGRETFSNWSKTDYSVLQIAKHSALF